VPEESTRTTTPPDKTNASLALKSREEEGTNMHTPSKKAQIMHTASRDLRRRRLQEGNDVIAAAAAVLEEPELGFHLERPGGCRVKRAKNDDASRKVSADKSPGTAFA